MLKCCLGWGAVEGGLYWLLSAEDNPLKIENYLVIFFLLGSKRRRWMNEIVTVLRYLKGIEMWTEVLAMS